MQSTIVMVNLFGAVALLLFGLSLVKDGVTIRLRQADLAQMAGTSRESVSRFLATLERAGVVQVGRGRVTVIEPERLDAYIF